MIIRRCSFADWPTVNRIFVDQLPIVTAAERSYSIRTFKSDTWLWEQSGEILGFAIVNNRKYRNLSWVEYLAVRQDFQSQGVGRRMLNALESQAMKNGAYWIALSTHLSNLRAIRFYQAKGYQDQPDAIPGKHLFHKSITNHFRDFEMIPLRQYQPKLLQFIHGLLFRCIVRERNFVSQSQ